MKELEEAKDWEDSEEVAGSDETEREDAHVREEQERRDEPEAIALPSGEPLEKGDVDQVLKRSSTTVVVVAGPTGCGKTTLLAAIYDAFQHGSFGNMRFAWSDTLVGFERRAHRARHESGKLQPEMERTKIEFGRYLHLAGAELDDDGDPHNHLIFTDLPGEQFEDARDSDEGLREIPALRRVNHFCILLDGAKLCEDATKHEVIASTSTLLRRCIDSGFVDESVDVQLIVTKYDIIEADADSDTIVELVGSRLEHIVASFSERVRSLDTAMVSACPIEAALENPYNVENVFRTWCRSRATRRYVTDVEIGIGVEELRFYEAFGRFSEVNEEG